MKLRSNVLRVPPAESAEAVTHFAGRMRFETDCWDVHYAMTHNHQDFILLDVRSRELYDRGHLPGALHLPHAEIKAARMESFPDGAVFVVYCAGPHCNGACKAALRLAELGRPVKEMIGGIEGWRDEGFDLIRESGEELRPAV